MKGNQKIIDALNVANSALSLEPAPDQQIRLAMRALSRQADRFGNHFQEILEKLNVASEQLQEAEFEAPISTIELMKRLSVGRNN